MTQDMKYVALGRDQGHKKGERALGRVLAADCPSVVRTRRHSDLHTA